MEDSLHAYCTWTKLCTTSGGGQKPQKIKIFGLRDLFHWIGRGRFGRVNPTRGEIHEFWSFFIFFMTFEGLGWFLKCLERFRHVLEAYIDLLKQPFFPAGGLCPRTPPQKKWCTFLFFKKMFFCVIGIIRLHNLRKRIAPWFPARKMLQDGGLLLFIAFLWTHFMMILKFYKL